MEERGGEGNIFGKLFTFHDRIVIQNAVVVSLPAVFRDQGRKDDCNAEYLVPVDVSCHQQLVHDAPQFSEIGILPAVNLGIADLTGQASGQIHCDARNMVPGNGDRDGIPLFGIHFIDFGTPASGVAALARRQQQLILFHGDQVFIDSRNTQIKLAGQFLAGHAAVCLQSLENTNTVIFLNVVTCNGIELLCHNVSFCMTRNILAYLTRHAGCLSSFLRARLRSGGVFRTGCLAFQKGKFGNSVSQVL